MRHRLVIFSVRRIHYILAYRLPCARMYKSRISAARDGGGGKVRTQGILYGIPPLWCVPSKLSLYCDTKYLLSGRIQKEKRSKGTVKRLLFPYFQYLLPRHIETDGTRVQERGEKDVVWGSRLECESRSGVRNVMGLDGCVGRKKGLSLPVSNCRCAVRCIRYRALLLLLFFAYYCFLFLWETVAHAPLHRTAVLTAASTWRIKERRDFTGYFSFFCSPSMQLLRFDYCRRVRNRNSSRPYFDTLARKSWAVQCVLYWLGQLFFLQRPAECVAKPTVLAAKESIIDERFLLWPIFSPDQLDIGWRKGRHVGRNLSVIDIVAISVW